MSADLEANMLLHAPKREREEAQQEHLSSIKELQQRIQSDSDHGLLPFPSITQLYQQHDTQQQQQQQQQPQQQQQQQQQQQPQQQQRQQQQQQQQQ
ncbi:hypothetical protein Emed_002496 [Eimeria media]